MFHKDSHVDELVMSKRRRSFLWSEQVQIREMMGPLRNRGVITWVVLMLSSKKTVVKRSLLFTRRYTWSISDRWRLSVQPAEHRGTSEGLVIATQINLEL